MDNKQNNLGEKVVSDLNKDFMAVGLRHVHGWYTWAAVGVGVGAIIAAMYVANMRLQFNQSEAGTAICPGECSNSYEAIEITEFESYLAHRNNAAAAEKTASDSVLTKCEAKIQGSCRKFAVKCPESRPDNNKKKGLCSLSGTDTSTLCTVKCVPSKNFVGVQGVSCTANAPGGTVSLKCNAPEPPKDNPGTPPPPSTPPSGGTPATPGGNGGGGGGAPPVAPPGGGGTGPTTPGAGCGTYELGDTVQCGGLCPNAADGKEQGCAWVNGACGCFKGAPKNPRQTSTPTPAPAPTPAPEVSPK